MHSSAVDCGGVCVRPSTNGAAQRGACLHEPPPIPGSRVHTLSKKADTLSSTSQGHWRRCTASCGGCFGLQAAWEHGGGPK